MILPGLPSPPKLASFLPGMFPGGMFAAEADAPFAGGNQSANSVYELLQLMAAGNDDMASPSAGGTLTINGESLGSYDYVIKDGNQTVSAFTVADWFTATEDSRSAFVVVKGDLTIGSSQVFIPSVRKLFTAIYVTGNLTITGEISMSARGANHSSATGSNVSAAAIRIATGTFSSVTNPQVPAAGAAGGTPPGGNSPGNAGATGTNGQTGGGGTGGRNGSSGSVGSGAAGTGFSGGSASGGIRSCTGANAGADGGAGGNACNGFDSVDTSGGAGNPGGSGDNGGDDGQDGTGGILLIVCAGTYSGAGAVSAAGADGGGRLSAPEGAGGGGSGGGSITILYGTDSGPVPFAPGGAGGDNGDAQPGGDGGDGTARKLAL